MTKLPPIDLNESPLLKLVAERVREWLVERETSKKGSRRELADPKNLAEEYSSVVMRSFGEVTSVCDQMDYATEMLGGFRARKSKDVLITRYDYLVYNLENYYLRAGMIMDRCLKLVNAVFDLGNQPKDCRYDSIVKNEHVSPTAVPTILLNIRNELKDIQTKRNEIAHFETFYHDDLYYVGIHSVLSKSGGDQEVVVQTSHITKVKTDKFVKEMKEMFKTRNSVVKNFLWELFTELGRVYYQKQVELDQKEKIPQSQSRGVRAGK